MGGRPLTAEQITEIIRLYGEGNTQGEVGSMVGVSQSGVYLVLKRNGIPARPRAAHRAPYKIAPDQKPRPRKLTDEQDAEILRLYGEGLPQGQIAEKFGISSTTLYDILKRNGVGVRKHRLTDDEAARACELYADGLTMKQAASQFGVNTSTVRDALIRTGAKVRSIRVARRQFTVNDHAFDVITPEAAYWAGFFFTDGTIRRMPRGNSDHVAIHISACDRGHLEKFRTFLGSQHAITEIPASNFTMKGRIYTGKPSVIFKVSSDTLAGRLRELGRYDGPVSSALTNSRDFWRGAIDGDGSMGMYADTRGTIYPHIELVGARRLLDEFFTFLCSRGLTGRAKINEVKKSNMWVVGANGKRVPLIVDLLYRDATVALDRKAQLAATILATWPPGQQLPIPGLAA